jgi:subtilisin
MKTRTALGALLALLASATAAAPLPDSRGEVQLPLVRALPIASVEAGSAWGTVRIGATALHEGGIRGAGVKVAVLDSGVEREHPALAAGYAGGANFVTPGSEPGDDSRESHGTHVAGIIAARGGAGGVVGVAPGASIFAVKVLDSSGSTSPEVLVAGLEWAIANRMDVVNMSLGTTFGGEQLAPLRDVCARARAAGIVLVAAAGFRNPLAQSSQVASPADFDSVVGVGATDPSDEVATISPTGDEIALVAPGVAILSAVRGGGYAARTGTSMAAPHVAGVAALLLSTSPDRPRDASAVDEVVHALEAGAADLDPPGRDPSAGAGLVQAEAALARYREIRERRQAVANEDGGGGCSSSGGGAGAAGALGLLAAAGIARGRGRRREPGPVEPMHDALEA